MKHSSLKIVLSVSLGALFGILTMLVVVGLIPSASADTFVEGHIESDTTWTEVDSPYVVSNDVIVDEGATLTIDLGVEVKYGGNFQIDVQGNLSAIGTNSKSISFTSNKVTPETGDWNTIKFSGGNNETFQMKYCIIKYLTLTVTDK